MEGAWREEAFAALSSPRSAKNPTGELGREAHPRGDAIRVGNQNTVLRRTLLKTGGDSKASRSTVLRMLSVYSHEDDTWRVDLETHLRIESSKRTLPSDHFADAAS